MSFYNIFNELVSQESILESMINSYQELHEAGKTEVTDFTEGSEVRTLLEVLSHLGYNLLEEANNTLKNHFISTAEGEYLDLLGANPNVNLAREQGSTATGLVKFTLANPTEEMINSEILIPAGAVVGNSEVEYETDADGIIGIGETSTYINVTCTIDGVEGNCKAGKIVNINELNSDFSLNCTNEEEFTNGADFEEDEAYRQRLLDFVRQDNFGSRGYYENLLLNIPNVHDIKQMGDGYATVEYVLNTNQGSELDEEAVFDAQALLTNSENIVLGHTYDIASAEVVPLKVTVTINSDSGLSEDDLIDIVKTYFRGGDCANYPYSFEGYSMGVTCDPAKAAEDIMNLNESISDLTFNLSVTRELGSFEAYFVNEVEVYYAK